MNEQPLILMTVDDDGGDDDDEPLQQPQQQKQQPTQTAQTVLSRQRQQQSPQLLDILQLLATQQQKQQQQKRHHQHTSSANRLKRKRRLSQPTQQPINSCKKRKVRQNHTLIRRRGSESEMAPKKPYSHLPVTRDQYPSQQRWQLGKRHFIDPAYADLPPVKRSRLQQQLHANKPTGILMGFISGQKSWGYGCSYPASAWGVLGPSPTPGRHLPHSWP